MEAVASAEAYKIVLAFNRITFFDRGTCKPERLILDHDLQKNKLVTVTFCSDRMEEQTVLLSRLGWGKNY